MSALQLIKRSITQSLRRIYPQNLGKRSMCSDVDDDVLFESHNGNRVIILNRPKSLNALDISMIRKLYPQIKEWESDPDTSFLLMKGAGKKAFCAGGDIKAVAKGIKSGNSLPQDFFREEYQLDNLIGTLKVPFVAIIDGITMGGGVGLSVHGHFRVATERTVFAMPETAIGLFPDVGGCYFLPRLGGQLGTFLALTGYRLKGKDVQQSGIATHYVNSEMLEDLEQDLYRLKSKSLPTIQDVLDKYHGRCHEKRKEAPFILKSKLGKINTIFSETSIEDIFLGLENDGSEWALELLHNMKAMSPTSMKVTLKALRLGANLSLQECLEMEYRLSQRFMTDNDFYEGVRATIIEKDNSPKWSPQKFTQVTKKIIDGYFAPLHPDFELKLE